MNNFPRPNGAFDHEPTEHDLHRIEEEDLKASDLTLEEIQEMIEDARKKAEIEEEKQLTWEQIENILDDVNKKYEHPTPQRVCVDPEQEAGAPRETFDYQAWLNGEIDPDTPIMNIADPRTI